MGYVVKNQDGKEANLQYKERASTKGAIKKFKVLTDLSFGKNVVSPQNPRETAPHYYENSFEALLAKLDVAK